MLAFIGTDLLSSTLTGGLVRKSKHSTNLQERVGSRVFLGLRWSLEHFLIDGLLLLSELTHLELTFPNHFGRVLVRLSRLESQRRRLLEGGLRLLELLHLEEGLVEQTSK